MTDESTLVHVVTTLSDRQEAVDLAGLAVEARLAACVQVSGPVTSVYRWEGSIQTDEEWVLTMKTPEEKAAELMKFIDDRHSYDTPEILVIEVDAASRAYAAWAVEST
jgi:periplasmic divalent cation tolerance protein